MLPEDHLARDVWRFVQGLDLSIALNKIMSVEGNAGRPAIDPKILLALWLFATLKGIGSARLIEEYCSEHNAFIWICGGVKVNYHTLSDFRSSQEEQLDALLTQTVAILAQKRIISLESVSQDGMRVRASAGSSSFRRKESLKNNLKLASMLISDLKEEVKNQSGTCKARVNAAQKKALDEKKKKIESALREYEQIKKNKIIAAKKERRKVKEKDLKNIRVSTTDPEARVMKMADGGFRPAYNVQFATTNVGKAIIGVEISKSGSDQKNTLDMMKQVESRYNYVPQNWLQDAGFNNLKELEKIGKQYKNCKIYMPILENQKNKDDPEARLTTDDFCNEWKKRMETQEASEIYKERCSTAEYVNAEARNRGLKQFLIRGVSKVKAVALLYAITQNMIIGLSIW